MSNPASASVRTVRVARHVARILLVLLCVFWGLFSLLSGAAEMGGGVIGLWRNSPNALPWLVLALLIGLAFRFERSGGVLIIAAGVFAAGQFDAFNVWQTMVLIPLPLILSGAALVLAGSIDPRG